MQKFSVFLHRLESRYTARTDAYEPSDCQVLAADSTGRCNTLESA